MAEYLSDEWIDALAAALRPVRLPAGTAPLVIEQAVAGVPGRGDVRYRVRIADGESGARPAAAGDPPAEVSLHTDYATAIAIATGAANAQTALAEGKLRLVGSVRALADVAAAIATLGDITTALRDATTFVADAGSS
jgi:hypothetical protein